MTPLLILGAVASVCIAVQVVRTALRERAFQAKLDEERRESLQRFHEDQRAQYERRKYRESFSNWPMGPKGDR